MCQWDGFLLSALRSTEATRTGADARMVLTIGGHPAVSNRHPRGPVTIHDYYLDLSGLQTGSFAVWTFEGSPATGGSECELQFIALAQSSRTTRRR